MTNMKRICSSVYVNPCKPLMTRRKANKAQKHVFMNSLAKLCPASGRYETTTIHTGTERRRFQRLQASSRFRLAFALG
jgi:hypothetical protein